MKNALFLILKLTITTVLLWMIFREHRFTEEILPHFQAMVDHWPWTLAGLVFVGISIWLSAVRWEILLRGQEQQITSAEVLRVTVVSNFFNITSVGVIGGDAYRVLGLMQRPGAKKLPLMVSVMLDHMLGMVGMGILFLSCYAAFSHRLQTLGKEAYLILEGFEMFMGGSLVMIFISAVSFTPRLYNWGEKQWPRMLGFQPLKKFATACDALRRDWRGSIMAVMISILIFIFHFLSFHCSIYAVGGEAPLLEVMAAMPIVDTAAGLPISVSGLGVREKTFETLMNALTGLPAGTAVAASLVGWLMSVIWGLIGGLVFLRTSGASLSKMASVEKNAA